MNGAERVTMDNGYKCECDEGYLGVYCEEEDNCYNGNTCVNGTKCIDGENNYTCSK